MPDFEPFERVLLTIEYDGSAFYGWQRQARLRSVQEELERALARATGRETTVWGASRTDAGVHAKRYCANFRTDCTIPIDRVPLAVNARLPADIAVVELSSFQLMTMERSADIAVVTNVAPNHLDVHKDMAEYVQAKKNVFAHQDGSGKVVLNYDNDITRAFAADAPGAVEFFSRQARPAHGVYLEDGTIFRDGRPIMDAADIRIPGVHNIENYMAAACAVEGLATDKDIDAVARSFAGVEHRIEFVREKDGVKYYNDSIASSPSRTIAGLHSFHQKLVLIAGGYDKKIPFDALGLEICGHVRLLILCGATAEKIEAAVCAAPEYQPGQPEILHAATLAEAVQLAQAHSVPGDIVTLSPACAAFDQFKNFMVRGETYKRLVQAL